MKSLFWKSSAMAAFSALPSLLQAQTVNPAQMPPAMTTPSSENEVNSAPTVTLPDPTTPLAVTNSLGDSVVVGANGIYSVHFASPRWTFTGNLDQGLTDRAINFGTDRIGQYLVITFHYTNAVQNAADIRLCHNSPIVMFAGAQSDAHLSANFRPADFGIPGNACVYDYFAGTGTVVNAGWTCNFTTTVACNTSDGGYFVIVPIGPLRIAFLGDPSQSVPRGKKRIYGFADIGVARATGAFAAGETNVTLSGYPPSKPNVQAEAGAANLV